jgi:hypothetical protein
MKKFSVWLLAVILLLAAASVQPQNVKIGGNVKVAGGGGAGGYNQVTDSKGGALTQRAVLFAADGLKATDDAANTRTQINELFSADGVWVKEEFLIKPDQQSGLIYGQGTSYNIAGTGTAIAGSNSTSTMVGVWVLTSGATSGNDATLSAAQGAAAGVFPAASATSYIFEVRFALASTADSYYAIGVQNNPPFSFSGPPGSGYWVEVTNTASAGNWKGLTIQGGTSTTITFSPTQTADTAVHVVRFVVTSSLITIFWDGVSVGSSSTNLPTSVQSPQFEAKTNAAAAKALNLDTWVFSMKR